MDFQEMIMIASDVKAEELRIRWHGKDVVVTRIAGNRKDRTLTIDVETPLLSYEDHMELNNLTEPVINDV